MTNKSAIKPLFTILLAILVSIGNVVNAAKPIEQFDNYAFFNDANPLHLKAAAQVGIAGVEYRANVADAVYGLVTIENSDCFKLARLTHSSPYLTPGASDLLTTIAINFIDSLASKELPQYRVIVTSVLRTGEDVKDLVKINKNAAAKSAHCHATTFDIAYKTFDKVNPKSVSVPATTLEQVLAEVLRDLRAKGLCYVKYERGQCCFHITCRYKLDLF